MFIQSDRPQKLGVYSWKTAQSHRFCGNHTAEALSGPQARFTGGGHWEGSPGPRSRLLGHPRPDKRRVSLRSRFGESAIHQDAFHMLPRVGPTCVAHARQVRTLLFQLAPESQTGQCAFLGTIVRQCCSANLSLKIDTLHHSAIPRGAVATARCVAARAREATRP